MCQTKKQFLPYFTEGDLVVDCLLSKPLPDVHTCTYTLPDRAVMVVINTSLPKRIVEFDVNLTPWIKSATGKYEMKQFNENGELVASTTVNAACHVKSKSLEINGMALIELIGE